MTEIALFPLELVLLPTERLPLHIFEPRYKELIGECLEQELEFGLVLADESGTREIGTTAAIVEVLERFPDGRMNIVVEGRRRFRIVELTGGRSFATANIASVEDSGERPTGEELDRCVSAYRRMAEAAEAEVDEPHPETDPVAYRLAAHVDFGTEVKQELLELLSERDRVVKLTTLFDRARDAIDWQKTVRGRAAGNGRVEPPG